MYMYPARRAADGRGGGTTGEYRPKSRQVPEILRIRRQRQ